MADDPYSCYLPGVSIYSLILYNNRNVSSLTNRVRKYIVPKSRSTSPFPSKGVTHYSYDPLVPTSSLRDRLTCRPRSGTPSFPLVSHTLRQSSNLSGTRPSHDDPTTWYRGWRKSRVMTHRTMDVRLWEDSLGGRKGRLVFSFPTQVLINCPNRSVN